MQTVDDCGAMAAIKISQEGLQQYIEQAAGQVTVSVANSPEYTVIAGPRRLLEEIITARCANKGSWAK